MQAMSDAFQASQFGAGDGVRLTVGFADFRQWRQSSNAEPTGVAVLRFPYGQSAELADHPAFAAVPSSSRSGAQVCAPSMRASTSERSELTWQIIEERMLN